MAEFTHLVATPETDAKLRIEYMNKGKQAFREGVERTNCPSRGGMISRWWLEGYDIESQQT